MVSEPRITALVGGLLIDGTGRGPIEDSIVLIRDKEIVAVGKEGEVHVPTEAKVIDVSGMTVMPGLIDAHMHFMGAKTDRFVEEWLLRPWPLGLIKSVFDAKALLEAGFTTVKDCGSRAGIYLREAIKEGLIKGPRIVTAGPALSQTFGHGDAHYLPIEWVKDRRKHYGFICDGVDECIRAARLALREGADFIKVCASGGVLSQKDRPEHVQFTLEELKAIVQVARNAGTFVTAHCQCAEGMKNCILAGVKTIDHAIFPDEEVIEMARGKEVIFVSTLSIAKRIVEKGEKVGMPPWGVQKAKEVYAAMVKNIRWLYESGMTMAAGTDFCGTPTLPHGDNSLELELLVKESGYKPMDAIIAVTKNAAKACGLEDQIGTIEKGKLADIIVVSGNPLKDITVLRDKENIKLVMKEGEIEVQRSPL